MGASCCPPDDSDPSDQRAQNDASPNSRKGKTAKNSQPVNPFKPGPRDVRIVQEDDGTFKKQKFNPNQIESSKDN